MVFWQSEQIQIEQKPFEPTRLAHAVRELFASVAQREGISFEVNCALGCPQSVEGDFKRLRQVVAQFASYIVESGSTDFLEITISHETTSIAEELVVAIDFAATTGPVQGKDDWLANLLIGHNGRDDDQFATDALGPSVSREILARMGGSLALDHLDHRIRLILRAPAPRYVAQGLHIHVIANSESLRTICLLALGHANFVVVEDPRDPKINTVLLEVSNSDELETLSATKKAFPNASIVALGRTNLRFRLEFFENGCIRRGPRNLKESSLSASLIYFVQSHSKFLRNRPKCQGTLSRDALA